MLIDLDYVERIFKMPEDAVLEKHRKDPRFQFIEDTIKELEWWACFEQESKELHPKPTNTAIKVEKIGRNEPCPCSSGKKYKKCCGALPNQ